MRNQKLNLTDLTDFLSSFNGYNSLASYFPQLGGGNEKIKELFTEPYHKSLLLQHWNDIEIHITSQTWGSTACGWGGWGGSAMTTNYNFIIKQLHTGLLFVYWGGKLAYIVHEKEIRSYSSLPSLSKVSNPIYVNSKRI